MSDTTAYERFLAAKVVSTTMLGFDVTPEDVNPACKPHVRAIVPWMVQRGRAACFSRFGLQKTVTQLEAVRLTRERAGGRGLIVCPLGVRAEFKRDAVERLGWAQGPTFIRTTAEAEDPEGIYLTNYESVRERKIDPNAFTVASLDEAAVLRGFGGTKTFREFMALFAGDDRSGDRTRGVPFRYVATATPSPNDYIELLAYAAYLDVMDVSAAKAQPLDASVLTPSGWRQMGEIRVGDAVMAGDGTPTTVLGVYPQGDRPIYRVTFSDGAATECDAEHLWLTRTQYERNNERRYRGRTPRGDRDFWTVKTTALISETLRESHGGANHDIPVVGPIEFEAQPVSVDPWLLGALLGDGCLRETSIVFSTEDGWMRERVAASLPPGLRLRLTSRGRCDYGITATGRQGGKGPNSNPLLCGMREYGLCGKRSWEKSVPSPYLYNAIGVRLAVLQGLLDTDGTVERGGVTFTSTSQRLAEDVRFLVRSLGGVAHLSRRKTSGRDAYKVVLTLPGHLAPFSLPRKARLVSGKSPRSLRRYIHSIELVGNKPAQCLAIEHKSRLYVTDDFVVTHNTRFFKRNSEKADQLTLHPHKEREFWLWVSSWAMFLQKPSDLGPEYSDEGYILPPLDVRWHEVPTDHADAGEDRDGQGRLFRNAAIGVVDAAREKRDSLSVRIERMAGILNGLHGRREKESVLSRLLPAEQGQVPGEVCHAAQDARRRYQEATGRESGPESGSAQCQAEGALSGRPALSSASELVCGEDSSGQLRTNAGSVPGNAPEPGRRVCDLSEANATSRYRPLPPDGGCAGTSLQALQYQPWLDAGGPGNTGAGGDLRQEQWVVWCDLNEEQRSIERVLDDLGISHSSLYGSLPLEERERRLETWRRRETTVLIGKPVLIGSGVNLQQCNRAIYLGIGFKFADWIQSIHRLQRYGQERPVRVDLIFTEAEREVRAVLEAKWRQHEELVEKMSEIIREFGLTQAAIGGLHRSMGVERAEIAGPGYRLVLNDSVLELPRIADGSVGLVVTSIPFAHQYEYSPSYHDFGHTDDFEHFWEQMAFLIPELLRVLAPGRVCAVHVKDRITPGGINGLGFQTVHPLSDECVAHFTRHGFAFLARKTVVTDVVRENAQTYRLGWTEQCKDGSRMGAGLPEYVLLFRKPQTDGTRGFADVPVVKSKTEYSRGRWQFDAHGFTRSSGDRPISIAELDGLTHAQIFQLFRRHSLTTVYDFENDVEVADYLAAKGMLPPTFMLLQPQSWHDEVWTDIARMRTLNMIQAQKGAEMHLCPLQFDIVNRLITQLSMTGETVLDPFGGLMTVPYCAVKLGREAIGIELSPRYFADGAAHVANAVRGLATPSLLDLIAAAEAADNEDELPVEATA